MSPNDIEILIHCHVSPSPHPRIDAPAVTDALMSLECHGLIRKVERDTGSYQTTGRGRAHIEVLCKTPLPVKKWVDHFGKIIGGETP